MTHLSLFGNVIENVERGCVCRLFAQHSCCVVIVILQNSSNAHATDFHQNYKLMRYLSFSHNQKCTADSLIRSNPLHLENNHGGILFMKGVT